ncbi:cytochrome d ubiquinol oxidase subunit II [Pantoea sp. B65]|uniref:cytochrome d ubiquinol oxidase subunit II n=1 Tax=Pantoea sp. B65 TaxID=2813359 RepID=UPI0039B67B93
MSVNPVDLSAAALAFSLLMYVLLDGTDLGVGMLFAWFPAGEDRRRLADSILPVWDANETWLVLLAGGMLALFPLAYSQLLSALYLPLFVMLLALFARAVALEYRRHASLRVQKWLDKVLIYASALAAFFQGVLPATVMNAMTPAGAFSWFALLPVLSGCGVMAGYLLLGCCWARWRLRGEVGELASLLASLFLVVMIIMMIGFCLLMPERFLAAWRFSAGKCLVLAAVLLCLSLPFLLRGERLMAPLLATLLLITCWLAMLMLGSYPWLIPQVMTLHDAAASPETQYFVLWGLAVIIPLTLAYNSWVFWVFHGKVH